MLLFTCDYLEGAHEKILQRLTETNLEKMPGYENDPYCTSAAEKIRAACECPEGSVFFTVGGTQTNAVVISTMLQSCEGVLAADTGHVNVHEAGAIELVKAQIPNCTTGDINLKLEHDDDYLQYEGRAQVNGVLYEFTIDKNTGTFVEWKWKNHK